jgi:exodeoxyribonuclease VII large subunit
VGLTAKLDAMSPLKVLTRGYAMTQTEDGSLLRSVKQTKIGDKIRVSLSDGSVFASVSDVKENDHE